MIGAGQLGSRHLQALALLREEGVIHVVDPSAQSRETAFQRFKEVIDQSGRITAQFRASISELPDDLDIAIVATNSDVRRQVVEQLLGHSRVKFLILEKVLFQKLDDYDAVQQLLDTHCVEAWVNCPRREWPLYRGLKKRLSGKQLYEVHVSGSNWGLGCNSIHLIDLIAFLSDKSEYVLFIDLLDPCTTASKRPGFIEFTGILNGRFSSGPSFSIASYAQGTLPDVIEVCGDGCRLLIRESEKRLWVSSDSDQWHWLEESFDVPYQSRLTNIVVERILETGKCDLPTYHESAHLHKPLQSGLLAHMAGIDPGRTANLCPIT